MHVKLPWVNQQKGSLLIKIVCAALMGICPLPLLEAAPPVAEKLLRSQWPASWIVAPEGPERDSGVFHFRKRIHLAEVPRVFIVQVTADNRYLLHVNGRRAGEGPARGDVTHWLFETYDLAPYLRKGENLLAATVWNFGVLSPMAQMSRRTGFLLQGNDEVSSIANTNQSWQAAFDPGHRPNPESLKPLRARYFYFAASPGEIRDGTKYDWRWDQDDSPRERWKTPWEIGQGHPRAIREGPPWMMSPEGWLLIPSPLPAMEFTPIPAGRVVRITGAEVDGVFPGAGKVRIPSNAEAKILLDRGEMTNAYPQLAFSGGREALVRLTYAEALYDRQGNKGNRNEIEGKEILGFYDEVIPDGGLGRSFSPLWFRTWRFLEISVKTGTEPLVLEGLQARYTGFPLKERARFTSDDPSLTKIWEAGWRTARLAAHETYMDAPYWEQLQYVGDTRIDALISYTVANEDRLARRAIELFDDSRLSEGITQSRYPTAELQYIPPYSLFWVSMLHDFWMYRDDPEFVRLHLPGSRAVLDWFLARQRPDGLLGFLPYWVHGDTGTVLDASIQDPEGRSGVITLQLLGTLREAAEMEEALGDKARAAVYREQAARAATAVAALWDPSHGLMADTPEKKSWGHPVNIFALYRGVVPEEARQTVIRKVLEIARHPAGHSASGGPGAAWPVSEIPSASFYFRFYLARALEAAGEADAYLSLLDPWRQALALGLTTWPEHPEPSRSDCHAWSAHPNFDFLRLVAGIKPASPGFHTVRIEPFLGPLKEVKAALPTPQGEIAVTYRRVEIRMQAEVILPEGMSGEFVWKGKTAALKPGRQKLEFQ